MGTTSRGILALAALLVVSLAAATSAAIGVKVRGGARIQAQARFPRLGQSLELAGALSDDDDVPLESAWIELRSGTPLGKARGCPSLPVSVAPLAGGLRVQTARGGEFCLLFSPAADKGSITLQFPGDSLHGAADWSIDFDRARPQRIATRLRFDPPVTTILLDQPKLILSAVLDFDASVHAARTELQVALCTEHQREIVRVATAGDGRVRFAIQPAELGLPGAGKLVARFEGNADLEPATAEQTVSRETVVALALDSDPPPADPGGEVVLALSAAALHGVVDGGVVEAIAGGKSTATAPVRAGRASLTVPVDPRASDGVAMTIRYLPASPYFRAGKPLSVRAAIAPPSKLYRLVLIAVVAAAAAWVFASWRRSRKAPEPARKAHVVPRGVHAVEDPGHPGRFSGMVIDAHEGTPLRGAEIIVRAPTLAGDGVLARTLSDARGEFAFELCAEARRDGAQIEAQSRRHSAESKSLPSGGTLKIALVTRRRALLERLVRWARRQGAPFDRPPEPTPGQVRAAAHDRPHVADWASDIETAAFGPGEVDAAAEQHLRDGEPK